MANCECYNEGVETYTGSISGDPTANIGKIHYCALHAAAGELLEALQNLTGCFSTNMLDQNNSREIWMAGLAIIRKTTEGG